VCVCDEGQSGLCEDRLTQCQTTLQPHYCYVEHNRRLCCRTCQALRRQRNDPGKSTSTIQVHRYHFRYRAPCSPSCVSYSL